MYLRRSILGKKVIAIGLLFSTSLLVIFPSLHVDQLNTSARYADWLRSQLGGVTSEAVEFAFSTALESDAENLDVFIETFIDAYTRASHEMASAPIARAALFALFQHRRLLLDNAVTPQLLLKSALLRTLITQDRSGAAFKGAYEHANAVKFGRQLLTFATHILPVSAGELTNPISPRAP